jgi:O-antigen ligase
VRTPSYYVLRAVAPGVAANDFVNHMVVRRLAQYNPDSYLGVAARPSAPFLYANNWGNVYSLLLPVVIAHLVTLRRAGGPRDRVIGWALAVAIAVSVPPAAYTLNRGMLVGLGVAALYLAVRLAGRGRVVAMVAIALLAVAGAVAFERLAGSRLETRLQGSGTATRASLYLQSLGLARESPVLGYGVPPTSQDPSAPPVGTQGQFWLVLVSNGPVAVAAFVSFFVGAWLRSWRRWDTVGLTASALCLVGVVELGFYGVVPYGLPIMMVLAAVALRPVSWSTPVVGERG